MQIGGTDSQLRETGKFDTVFHPNKDYLNEHLGTTLCGSEFRVVNILLFTKFLIEEGWIERGDEPLPL